MLIVRLLQRPAIDYVTTTHFTNTEALNIPHYAIDKDCTNCRSTRMLMSVNTQQTSLFISQSYVLPILKYILSIRYLYANYAQGQQHAIPTRSNAPKSPTTMWHIKHQIRVEISFFSVHTTG